MVEGQERGTGHGARGTGHGERLRAPGTCRSRLVWTLLGSRGRSVQTSLDLPKPETGVIASPDLIRGKQSRSAGSKQRRLLWAGSFASTSFAQAPRSHTRGARRFSVYRAAAAGANQRKAHSGPSARRSRATSRSSTCLSSAAAEQALGPPQGDGSPASPVPPAACPVPRSRPTTDNQQPATDNALKAAPPPCQPPCARPCPSAPAALLPGGRFSRPAV